ncbi:MAG: squalene/phytoene synthase family protein [Verrucomicrobiota bacterium]
MPDASEITRRAQSNLAFALRILPRQQRADMVVFYALCRTLDDLADAPGIPAEQRSRDLAAWRDGLRHGFANPTTLQQQVLDLRERRGIPASLLLEIIEGCQRDLQPQRFQTWDELAGYVWQVACVVGLVSIRLFGCQHPDSERYAVALGRALQLTNILRDLREDHDNGGRIYLPLEDLARFHYTEQDLAARVRDERFLALMAFEADRAEGFFREAAAALPMADRRALAPARIMAAIYHHLLDQMRRDGFRVFDRRYRVSKIRKLAILARQLVPGG